MHHPISGSSSSGGGGGSGGEDEGHEGPEKLGSGAAGGSNECSSEQPLMPQLASLQADNERLEADRREMGMRLGEYRATVAKVCKGFRVFVYCMMT